MQDKTNILIVFTHANYHDEKYYDRISRNKHAYHQIAKYIRNYPATWRHARFFNN